MTSCMNTCCIQIFLGVSFQCDNILPHLLVNSQWVWACFLIFVISKNSYFVHFCVWNIVLSHGLTKALKNPILIIARKHLTRPFPKKHQSVDSNVLPSMHHWLNQTTKLFCVILLSKCKIFIRIRGAYLLRISNDGQTIAIAVNQRQPYQSQLMFVHPYTATSLAVDVKGLGSKNQNVLSQFAK